MEITGALVMMRHGDPYTENCGGVLRMNQFKLAHIKDLPYQSNSLSKEDDLPTGEVCVKGLSVFKGYFLDIEKTRDAFDDEGWFKTGDVGRIMPKTNRLKIIDRVKEIFKLSQGEYIAPSKLENCFIKSKFVLQICIYGDSYSNFIIAIVVPNKCKIAKFLKANGIDINESTEIQNFYTNEKLHHAVLLDLEEIAKENNFNSFEKPRKLILSHSEFTILNELITPTMKLIRKNFESFFKLEIANAYT